MITKTVFIWSRPGNSYDPTRGVASQIQIYEQAGWCVKLWHWHTKGAYVVFERQDTIGVDGHR